MSAEDDSMDWRDELLDDDDWPTPLGSGGSLVCRCHAVEEQEIEALIAEGADLPEIARRTGATTACSGCRRSIEAMLASRG